MSFITPALLAGAALVAVPIVLHLIMRRETQKLVFPALRFVQQRRNLNQHRLQLRHWLLLALRCAVIALLALALARPTLRGSGASGKEDAPVAAAFVFDNSLRMQYEKSNESRLDQAKELAEWLLAQIPSSNPITVVDRAGSQRGQDIDRSAAELRVERLTPSADVRPMADALRDATRWLEDKRDYRGEIYVFTDLSTEAWGDDTRSQLASQLDALPGTNVYLIDVGVERPHNVGLGELRLSGERLAPGGVLRLDTDVTTLGTAPSKATNSQERIVELYVTNTANTPEKRGQQIVTLSEGQTSPIEFSLAGLGLGVHQGFVRISAGDPLPSDDVRYFTVDVQPSTKVLLLGENEKSTLFLREALAPSSVTGNVQTRFQCDVATFTGLESRPLTDYAAICVVDPPPLPAASWQALVDFAQQGGGVGVFLGRNARRDPMNEAGAQALLPAKLRWQSRDTTYLRPVANEHPALGELRDLADVPWSEFPVFKYWELEPSEATVNVVASFANGKPALVEWQTGVGRVLMLTTPVSDAAFDDPWNLLPTGNDPWPFLALANSIVDYLTASSDTRLNYFAGQTVVLPIAPEEKITNYVLQMPDGSALRQPITPGQTDISIASTELLGNYRLRAGGNQSAFDRGFSVNMPADLSQLVRVDATELIESLGESRARIARTRDEIEVRVGLARTGQELFPVLILILALILAAEGLLANRFYSGSPAVGPPSPKELLSTPTTTDDSREAKTPALT